MRQTIGVSLLCLLCCTLAGTQTLVLTGKVMDEQGKPVRDAGVWLRRYSPDETLQTTTDATGSFHLALEARKGDRYLTIRAVAEGLSVAEASYKVAEPAPVVLRLKPEAQVRGRVLDPDGQPIAAAEVSLRTFREAGADRFDTVSVGPEPLVAVETDPDGRFAIGHAPEGAEVSLLVAAEGFARWLPWYDDYAEAIAGSAEEYEIRLRPASVLEGTVRHNGQPVAGRKVWAGGVHPTEGWDESITDGQGHYRLSRLGPGTYNVCIDDLTELVAPAHEKVTVGLKGHVEGLDFELTPGGFIEGRIVDAETGEGIPDGRAAGYGPTRPHSNGACFGTALSPDGTYRLRVAPGLNYVYYQGGAEGYPYSRDANYEIEVREGETVRGPDIKVKRAEPIVIEVFGPEGKPVPGATVRIAGDYWDPFTADENGRCEILDLEPDRPLVAIAKDPADRLTAAVQKAADERQTPVRIDLQPGAAVTLRLVDPQGEPVPAVETGVSVKLAHDFGPWMAGSNGLATATSDGDGLVQLQNVAAGVEVYLSADRRTANQVEWPQPGPLLPGQSYDLGEVVLDLQMMAVSGQVLSADLAPVEGAMVRASQYDTRAAYSDRDGRFTIEGLVPDRPVIILAIGPEGSLFGAEEVVPEWEFEPGIILSELGTLRFRLVDEQGNPVPGHAVEVSPDFPASAALPTDLKATSDAEGRVTIEGVAAGMRYNVLTREPGLQGMRIVAEPIVELDGETDLGDVTIRQ